MCGSLKNLGKILFLSLNDIDFKSVIVRSESPKPKNLNVGNACSLSYCGDEDNCIKECKAESALNNCMLEERSMRTGMTFSCEESLVILNEGWKNARKRMAIMHRRLRMSTSFFVKVRSLRKSTHVEIASAARRRITKKRVIDYTWGKIGVLEYWSTGVLDSFLLFLLPVLQYSNTPILHSLY
jgi:hypothetical protein